MWILLTGPSTRDREVVPGPGLQGSLVKVERYAINATIQVVGSDRIGGKNNDMIIYTEQSLGLGTVPSDAFSKRPCRLQMTGLGDRGP